MNFNLNCKYWYFHKINKWVTWVVGLKNGLSVISLLRQCCYYFEVGWIFKSKTVSAYGRNTSVARNHYTGEFYKTIFTRQTAVRPNYHAWHQREKITSTHAHAAWVADKFRLRCSLTFCKFNYTVIASRHEILGLPIREYIRQFLAKSFSYLVAAVSRISTVATLGTPPVSRPAPPP